MFRTLRAEDLSADTNPLDGALTSQARCGPPRRAFPFSERASIVDAGDEIAAADYLAGGAREPDVVARVLREQDLVAGDDLARVRADRGDDPGAAVRLGTRREDQPGAGLRLFVELLDDDVVVERLEREADRG